jgi:abortive infection bacteriophage resistance protein
MNAYQKPYKSFDEQLSLIQDRGLDIIDPEFAKAGLIRLGYYRLSGYWYPFRVRNETHREGIDTPENDIRSGYSLDDIIRICDFDSHLRNLILAAISHVEVASRVAVAYETGKHDPFAYLSKTYWEDRANDPAQGDEERTQFEVFCDRHKVLVERSKEPFAKHFRETYGGVLPVWAAVELWDFGTLSRFFQVMQSNDRMQVARRFSLNSGRIFQGWIEALNDLRNFCAHHQRLNRRHFPVAPAMPKARDLTIFHHVRVRRGRSAAELDQSLHQLYPLMCVLSFLLVNSPIMPAWRKMMITQFETVSAIVGLSLSDYGIPDDWTMQQLWQILDSVEHA